MKSLPEGYEVASGEPSAILAADTSIVNSGVSKFSKSWRLHFALDVFTLACHEFKTTRSLEWTFMGCWPEVRG
ncbi:MAG: hypothetical protein FWC26_14330 [Fibromonadales bacterium]|nr:hypothetical protein [Fibromonadales bacterium]